MGLLLLIILVVLPMGGLLTWGYSQSWGHSETAAMPIANNVRVTLRYRRDDLKSLLAYAKIHDVERGGRYDLRKPPRLNIWTHTWGNPGCRAESTLMFSLYFDWSTTSLMSVRLQPGYDWEVFLNELARLERAALGDMVYGRSRCEPKT
jgi:hypothetical protein